MSESPRPDELYDLTIHDAQALIAQGEIKASDIVGACLNRIDTIEDKVRAFVTVTADRALEQAQRLDNVKGNGGPLTGMPVQIKDLISTRGVATTCASRMLEGYVPTYDAGVVERLSSAGAVMVGKGNMDEFGMGSSTENSAFHPTHNPWDLGRVPGGSSGGGAAAVAAGEALYALGSDTGGSIRQPASLCGVVGIKPTYGLVSRYGLIAYASSFDQIGPITKDVTDCALVLKAIAGHDPRDSTSLSVQVPDYPAGLAGGISGLRIGMAREYFAEGMEEGVRQAVEAAVSHLEGLGAHIVETSLPSASYALACYYILAPSECSANLARYDGVKYGYSYRDTDNMWEAMEKTRQQGFGPEVKRRIMLGAYALSAGYYDAYYLKAQKVRTLIIEEFQKAFESCDVLATPTSPTVAFKLGEKLDDPIQMYLSDVYTVPVNVAGLPAISVPCGFSQGLPVGLQLIGPPLSEQTLLRTAYAYEQSTIWHLARPQL